MRLFLSHSRSKVVPKRIMGRWSDDLQPLFAHRMRQTDAACMQAEQNYKAAD